MNTAHAAPFHYQLCPELMEARASNMALNPEGALRLYERAIKRNPKNLLVLQEACEAFVHRYELRKAHHCIQRILKIGTQCTPQVLLLAGQLYLRAYRPKLAIECFQKATRLKPNQPNNAIELAALLEKAGKTEQATEQIESALALDPNNGIALRLQAQLSFRLGNLKTAEQQFAQLASNEKHAPQIRAQALNGWAHLLDSQQQHDDAFAKLMQSKALQQNQQGVSQIQQRYQKEYAQLHKIIDSVDSSTFDFLADAERRHAPNYLLTGCPRSGTTLIEKILDAHPEIISADEYNVLTSYILPDLLNKHLDPSGTVSATQLSSMPLSETQHAANHYRKAIELALGEKIGKRQLIDKNPGLTAHIPALLHMEPATKVIYALRDPRDIALSALFRWLPLNTASVSYLDPASTCAHIAQELGFWLKLRNQLPAETWRETRYEDTVTDLKSESSSLLDWMQLSWTDAMSNYRSQLETKGVNSPTYNEVSQPVHTQSVQKWKHYSRHLEPHFEQLSSTLEALQYH